MWTLSAAYTRSERDAGVKFVGNQTSKIRSGKKKTFTHFAAKPPKHRAIKQLDKGHTKNMWQG